ncbi:MAG: transcription elongation factor subunit Spt4 [Candidatus Aenigmatarchaeota archaeon]
MERIIIVHKACQDCKRILDEHAKECPVCKTQNLTRNFQGVVAVFNADSETAKKLGITSTGKFALKV